MGQAGTSWLPEKAHLRCRRSCFSSSWLTARDGKYRSALLCLGSAPPSINLPVSLTLGLCLQRSGQSWRYSRACTALLRWAAPWVRGWAEQGAESLSVEEGRWGARGRSPLLWLGGLWLPSCAPEPCSGPPGCRTDPAAAAAVRSTKPRSGKAAAGAQREGCSRPCWGPPLRRMQSPACRGSGAEPHCRLGWTRQRRCSR